jgi:hypothetical protein
MDIKPRHAGDDGGPDCRRPRRASAGRKRRIPALDHGQGFVTCGLLSYRLLHQFGGARRFTG